MMIKRESPHPLQMPSTDPPFEQQLLELVPPTIPLHPHPLHPHPLVLVPPTLPPQLQQLQPQLQILVPTPPTVPLLLQLQLQ